jgi:drug/metabolite transporter (DMT)-like permease
VSPGGLSERQKAYGAWLAICVIWGTTYLGIRVSIETMPPFLMAGFRWVLAGTALTAILKARGTRFPALRAWPPIALMGFLLLVVGNGGVVWAEQYVSSGQAAVIVASGPFWMVGVEAISGGERITGRAVLGLSVGFAGIMLLVWPELGAGGPVGSEFGAGVIALQLACAGWAVGSSLSKRHSQEADVFSATALQMLLGGAMLLAIGTAGAEWPKLHFSTRSAIAFLYLTTIGSIGAFVAYVYALKHLPVAFVSLYAYINPVIAVVLGMLLLGEPFTSRMGVAAAIVLIGVAIVRRRVPEDGARSTRAAA